MAECDVIVRVCAETLENDFLAFYEEGTDFEVIEWDTLKDVATVRVFRSEILTVRRTSE